MVCSIIIFFLQGLILLCLLVVKIGCYIFLSHYLKKNILLRPPSKLCHWSLNWSRHIVDLLTRKCNGSVFSDTSAAYLLPRKSEYPENVVLFWQLNLKGEFDFKTNPFCKC